MKWAFPAARKYPKECRETRLDVERRVCRALTEWKGEKWDALEGKVHGHVDALSPLL